MRKTQSEWAPMPGFPEYFVSVNGDIMSRKKKTPRILKPIRSRDGHLYVFMYNGGQMFKVWIHRAVLSAHKRKPHPREEGRHLDGNPGNNWLDNLAWGTKQQNMDDKKVHGTQPKGERTGTHKLSEADVLAIRKLYGKRSLRDLAKEYGVSHTAIRRAALGIKWAHLKEGIAG